MSEKMTEEEVREFKKIINGEIDLAIAESGGIAVVRQTYEQMPNYLHFLAGWVTRSYWIFRQAQLYKRRMASQEEIRRIHDLVRLRLETGSSTS